MIKKVKDLNMNGRVFFGKYYMIIENITRVVKLLPPQYRKWRLKGLCYKEGNIVMLKRYIFLKSLAKKVGKNVSIFPGVYFENIEKLTIGDNVSIHQMCYIDAEGGIEIGNNVSIAHRTTILSSNHNYADINIPIKYQGMILKNTIIENNIWIGCNSVILAGVHIEDGCVIGAGTIVSKNIEKNSIAVGCPAKIIKKRG